MTKRTIPNEPKVLVINESDGASILSDIFTFGCILSVFWANYEYLGNGVVLQLVLAVMFFVGILRAGTKVVTELTPEQALEYLQKGQAYVNQS